MKKELSNGFIEIKDVDVADKMIILGEMGYSYSQLEELVDNEDVERDSPQQLIFIGKLIKKFKELVLSIEIEVKGKKIVSYDEAIKSQDFINEIMPTAISIFGGEESEEQKEKKHG